MNGYCLDANAVIDICRRVYPRHVFKELWVRIDLLVDLGQLKIAEEVLNELSDVDDDAYKWAKSNATNLVVPLKSNIQSRVKLILAKHNLVRVKKGKPKSQADPFVIATAIEENLKVVTSEKFSGDPAHPRIPDACKAMKVPCHSVLEMFEYLGWKV